MSRLLLLFLVAASSLAGCSPTVTVNEGVDIINPSLPACSPIGYSGTYYNITGEYAYDAGTTPPTEIALQNVVDSGTGFKESSTATLPSGLQTGQNYHVEIKQNGIGIDNKLYSIYPGPVLSTNTFSVSSTAPQPGVSLTLATSSTGAGSEVTLTPNISGPYTSAYVGTPDPGHPSDYPVKSNVPVVARTCWNKNYALVGINQCASITSPVVQVMVPVATIGLYPPTAQAGTSIQIDGTGFTDPASACIQETGTLATAVLIYRGGHPQDFKPLPTTIISTQSLTTTIDPSLCSGGTGHTVGYFIMVQTSAGRSGSSPLTITGTPPCTGD